MMDDLRLTPQALDGNGNLKIWTPPRLGFVISVGVFLPAITLYVCSLLAPLHCEERDGLEPLWFYENYLSACVYTWRDIMNFGIGYICMCFWSLCLAPQIIVNHVLGRADDQSILFYLLWVAGDVTNLLGCVIGRQLPTQIGVAVIYLVLTLMLLVQYLYYNCIRGDDKQEHDYVVGSRTPILSPLPSILSPRSEHRKAVLNSSSALKQMRGPDLRSTSEESYTEYGGIELKEQADEEGTLCTRILGIVLDEKLNAAIIIMSFMIIVGLCTIPGILDQHEVAFVSGWAMTIYYTISRIPQIILIITTQTVSGLSPIMFVMTSLGNITYILQILVADLSPKALYDAIPWLVQAILCIGQDLAVLILYSCFAHKAEVPQGVMSAFDEYS
uniref:Uncharacterized protein n=1 Tax=Lotharella globosa TaxID=91324 RepID=A0A7S3Z3G6_9EUKA|mmetsp:Transcript_29770/g.57441  ORF Transcript_29770/g.57441 Transcript_29770/m.57441 type:complete len:387 (+) Transcript_29770:206-1366(+)